MPDVAASIGGPDKLDGKVTALAKVAARVDVACKHELVVFRRQLSDEMAALHHKITKGKTVLMRGDLVDAFRALFSKTPNRVTVRPGRYPAVLLDNVTAAYKAPGDEVFSLIRETVAWVRDILRAGRG